MEAKTTTSFEYEGTVLEALQAFSGNQSVLKMHKISAFNLKVAQNALQNAMGGTLTIQLPTKAGGPVEVAYSGETPR